MIDVRARTMSIATLRLGRWMLVAMLGCQPAAAGPSESPPTGEPQADPDPGPEEPAAQPPPDPPAQPEPTPQPPPDEPPPEPIAWTVQDKQRIAKVTPIILAKAKKHDVEPGLVAGIIWVESKFHARARGPAGAQGLMQLMPRTARALAKKLGRTARPYDPDFNIDAGTYYLSRLLAKLDGDPTTALAAYGRGLGRIQGILSRGEPLPESSKRFAKRVARARMTWEQARARGDV